MTARRTCEQCGSMMPQYVPRKTVNGRKVCEGCRMWHAKTAAAEDEGLENPIHKQTGKHPHEWYHGSKHEFHEFGDPEHDSPLSFSEDNEDNSHWNTLLGNHFTSDHQVAADFAEGHHSSANNSSGEEGGRVIHARLHLKNPKVYASEHDMDQEVHEFEHAHGNTIDSHFPPPSEEETKDWDQFDWEDHHAEMGRAQHYANDSAKPFDRDESDPGQPYSGHVHPKSMGWLNHHPDKYNIAVRFKHRLQEAGHDGIVYGNEFERSNYGQQATSAIAFHPHQIEITQDHTVNKNCLKPEELKRRPGPGQEMIPGTENLRQKRPYSPAPSRWTHPVTWHDPKMWREGKMTPHGIDWGRLTAPLPQECWDRYHGRHTAALGDPTDWDTHHPTLPGEVHRGMPIKFSQKVREQLTSGPKADAAQEILAKTQNKPTGPHWSTDLDKSRDFSKRTSSDWKGEVPVVMHGVTPARDDIETRPAALKRMEIFPYDDRVQAEREVPVRKGKYVDVVGVSWHAPQHPEADEQGWVRHDFATPRQHTATVYPGHETALHEMGQQTVYPVSTPRGVTNLCQHHLNVHQSIAEGSNDLAGHLGIPQAPSEPLGAPQTGKCVDCNKNTSYQLKLQRPEGYDRQQSRDSQQPRTRRTGPYMPSKTKPLIVLRQSQNARSGASDNEIRRSHNGSRSFSRDETTDSVESRGSNRGAPGQRLDHLRGSTFSQVGTRLASDKSDMPHYYYHGTTDDAEYTPESNGYRWGGDHTLRPGALLHRSANEAWDHAIKNWTPGYDFPRVYRTHRNSIPADTEHHENGKATLRSPMGAEEVQHDTHGVPEGHPELRGKGETHHETLFHGTAHDEDDDELEHIHPHHRSVFNVGASDSNYAYATPRLNVAWDYAERRAEATGGRPAVYRVTPHNPEDVEDDPLYHGERSRGNYTGDLRSKSGFKVLDPVPMSAKQQREHDAMHEDDDDDDWGDSHYGVKLADRQLSLFPAPPRVPKNPRKPKAPAPEKPAAPTLPPVEERSPLHNGYNMHRRPHQERQHWYHGGMHDLDLSRETGEIGKTSHWNTGLGPHFAGNEKLAGVFATADEDKGESGPGRITHAKLLIANPKHYKSEYEMDHEVLKDEVARGTFDKDDPGVKGDLALKRSPFAMARLSNHPDASGIAQRFKQKLIDKGHDGITYKNSIETGQGLCAIPFSHDQVKITQSHDFDPKKKRTSVGNPYQCERPERTAMKKLPTLRMVAHDATENQELRHCPFCGAGKIIGRQDGSIECEFCHQYFTVQVQPQYPNFPQTIDGQPQQIPGMPGQVETPPGASVPGGGFPPAEDGSEDAGEGGNPFADHDEPDADDAGGPPDGDADDSGGDEPPPFAKKSFRTVTGALLDEENYARHLAIRFSPDRDAMIALIRQEQGAR